MILKAILLPGLDGNADLLGEFASHSPADTSVAPIELPDDPSLDYAGLCDGRLFIGAVPSHLGATGNGGGRFDRG